MTVRPEDNNSINLDFHANEVYKYGDIKNIFQDSIIIHEIDMKKKAKSKWSSNDTEQQQHKT